MDGDVVQFEFMDGDLGVSNFAEAGGSFGGGIGIGTSAAGGGTGAGGGECGGGGSTAAILVLSGGGVSFFGGGGVGSILFSTLFLPFTAGFVLFLAMKSSCSEQLAG